ncbi:MAG: pyridoxamine 5'-phosphate oxidase family protein [Lachnospiraceae bacterium]|nr:pyridoxamine 5'-phosphate oxidase family protein [Lachnospiraceae bacterium]
MSVVIEERIKNIINDKDTIKVLATTDRDGIPHVVPKGSARLLENGKIEVLELIESSQTNKNLTASIWFDQTVAFNFISKEKESFQIKGKVERVIISGREFERRYVELREHLGDVDLSGIWIIEPESVVEETFKKRFAEEWTKHPEITHLDRIAKD